MQFGLSVHAIPASAAAVAEEYAFQDKFLLLAATLYSFLFLFYVLESEIAWTEGPNCTRVPQIHGPKGQIAQLGARCDLLPAEERERDGVWPHVRAHRGAH